MKNLTFAFTALLFLTLQSCSKEKKIEHSLQKKDGKWNITQLTEEYYNNGTLYNTVTTANAGYFIFENNGDYQWKSISSSYPDGTWTNSSDKISLTTNGQVTDFNIVESSKNKMSLRWIDPDVAGGAVSTEGLVLVLERN